MMYGYELDVVVSDDFYYEEAYPLYMEAMVRNSREYCDRLGCDASTLTGAFMHLSYYSESTQNRAESITPDMYILNNKRFTGGTNLASAIHNPSSFGHPEWNEGFAFDKPYAVGNESILKKIPQSWLYKIPGSDPMYILSVCQARVAWGEKNWKCK
jgi:hypothetical protein